MLEDMTGVGEDKDYIVKMFQKLEEKNETLQHQYDMAIQIDNNTIGSLEQDVKDLQEENKELTEQNKKIEKIVRESNPQDIFDKCLRIWYGEDEEEEEED
jgi:septal ring factor EnvC (AmiA/AmiB activator)